MIRAGEVTTAEGKLVRLFSDQTKTRSKAMVSSVSAQIVSTIAQYGRSATTANSASVAQRNGSNETGSGAAAGVGSSDPAVVLSLSKEAWQSLMQQGEDRVRQAFADRAGVTLSDAQSAQEAVAQRSENMHAMMEVRHQMAELRSVIANHEMFSVHVADWQKTYDQLLNTKPVPATELTGKEKEAAFAMLKQRGLPLPAKGGIVSFSPDDHMLLTFKDDGSVWIREGDVPETEADKQFFLSKLSERISRGRQDISGVVSQYEALIEQYDALHEKYGSGSSH